MIHHRLREVWRDGRGGGEGVDLGPYLWGGSEGDGGEGGGREGAQEGPLPALPLDDEKAYHVTRQVPRTGDEVAEVNIVVLRFEKLRDPDHEPVPAGAEAEPNRA